MFLCCLDFGVWSLDHRVKIFSFFFSLSFLCLFWSLLSSCLASLPHFVALRPQIATVSPCYTLCYFVMLPHCVTSLPHHVASLPCCLLLLGCYCTLGPFCCFVTLLLYTSLPHCFMLVSTSLLPPFL